MMTIDTIYVNSYHILMGNAAASNISMADVPDGWSGPYDGTSQCIF